MDLLVCLGSLSCCITQVRLSLRSQTNSWTLSFEVQNSWFHQLWQVIQVLELKNSPTSSHYQHHVWLLVWCTFYEMLCWFYARCNRTHTFQRNIHLSLQSTDYLPKSLGDNQDIFWYFLTNLRRAFCVLFGQQWLLTWNSPMDAVLAQSLSCCWIMNADLNWGQKMLI